MKYIILSIVLLYLLFVMYCKVRFRFWSIQPVFHIHNLYYWIFPCGIIDSKLPPITKFIKNKFGGDETEKGERVFLVGSKETSIIFSHTYNPIKIVKFVLCIIC